MGDYSLGHFKFSLKKNTPKDVTEKLRDLIDGNQIKIEGHDIYLGESAYHAEKSYALIDITGEDSVQMYSMTFQIKWGDYNLDLFAKWLSPYVEVTDENKGFFGYRQNEYTGSIHIYTAPKS